MRVVCMEQIACDVVGGVVFTNMQPDDDSLPKNVKYTIRTRSTGEMTTTYAMTPQPDSASPRSFEKGGKLHYRMTSVSFLSMHHLCINIKGKHVCTFIAQYWIS